MNIQVKHDGDDISQYVISYERDHKICTAIGTLTLIVSDNIATTFNPWDEIDIFEEGDFKVRYYVSTIDWSIPNSTITLDCQDESKRLVDYFIPDQYTVEYPTYTRFWIEKFLDEVGTSYSFQTSSQGNLLSNFTSMGLMSAYEQIIVLLQLSGWYMFFDGNGVAQIGTLNTDLTDYAENLQKHDILDINVKKDDRMLRNRALVWGNYNPISLARVFADVQVHTPWNYDHQDVRTMVIANSNIPNNSSAFNIANLLVKEFARITVEKHLTATGARDLQLGDVVKVNTTVYTGSGLITTFGVSMGKDGLVTNLILDERCPRLFGYFNFGDYVYVGTYGDGVWRKHLKFVHNWENFSSGLDDLRVTDLHINNGIFTSVTASGGMFYKVFDDVPWSQVPHPESLESSELSELGEGGSGLVLIPFSGVHARASMVDKNLNRIIYGLDTYSGENLGDYYLTFSGMMLAASGGVVGSGMVTDARGWVLAYTPGAGTYITYPISVSGEYNIRVLDIENDGKNDYVSVLAGDRETLAFPDIFEWEYGEVSRNYKDGARVALGQLDGAITTPVETLNMSRLHMAAFGVVDKYEWHRVVSIFRALSGFGTYLLGSTEFDYTDAGAVQNGFGWLTGLTGITVPALAGLVSPIRSPSKGVYRFMGVESGDLNLYEAVETVGGSFTVTPIVTFPVNPGVLDYEDDLVLIEMPIEARRKQVTVLNMANGSSQIVTIVEADFDFAIGTLIQSCLVGGLVHSVGMVVEDLITTYKYYAINHIGTGDLGVEFLDSDSSTNTFANVRKVTATKSWGFFSVEGVAGGDRDFSSYPGGAIYEDLFPSHGVAQSYIADTERNYDLLGGTLMQYADITGGPSTTWIEVDMFPYTPRTLPGPIRDFNNNLLYIMAYKDTSGPDLYVLGVNDDLEIITVFRTDIAGDGSLDGPLFMVLGNCLVRHELGLDLLDLARFSVNILDNPEAELPGNRFLVLQRDEEDFHIVQEAAYPIRIDISNSSPLLTLQHKESTFNSFSIYDSEVFQTTISPTFSGLLVDVPDYRYTFLPGSGELGISKQAVYIRAEDIWGFDVLTFSGVDLRYEDIAGSGLLNRIETSNFVASGQYIFVTTSGDIPQFYQKDPELEYFTLYSGLPDSRATIIRLDDRI